MTDQSERVGGTLTGPGTDLHPDPADPARPRDPAEPPGATALPAREVTGNGGAGRSALFVVGTGRSGTSAASGLMRILGFHVPQPELSPDETNPKGFAEPTWMIDFHDRLLRRAVVQVNDSRPDAWRDAAHVGSAEHARATACGWLEEQFGQAPALVLKDPRLAWFLPVWRAAVDDCGADASFLTMLRPPAEVVLSKQVYYGNRLGAAHLTASWLNMMLYTELHTRPTAPEAADGTDPGGGPGTRVLVRFEDLLADWPGVVERLAVVPGCPDWGDVSPEQREEAGRFVDPTLRRMDVRLDDLALPRRLRELTEESWQALCRLVEPGGDVPAVHADLDQLRTAYAALYSDAEAVSRSSVVAAEHRVRRDRRDPSPAPRPSPEAGGSAVPAPAAGAAAAPAFAADRVPHRARALVPGRVRRWLRRAVGRERPLPPLAPDADAPPRDRLR